MLERKAVIEARKEYLESLHVKRVSIKCLLFFRWGGRGERRAAKNVLQNIKTNRNRSSTNLSPPIPGF